MKIAFAIRYQLKDRFVTVLTDRAAISSCIGIDNSRQRTTSLGPGFHDVLQRCIAAASNFGGNVSLSRLIDSRKPNSTE